MKRFIILCFFIFFYSPTVFAQWNWVNPRPHGHNIPGSYFTSATTGYLVGDAGRILKTTDGGDSWITLNSQTVSQLTDIYFTDANTAYVSAYAGLVFKTTDAGVTWNKINTGVTENLWSIFFTDMTTGYASGDFGRILKTVDAGATWTPLTSGAGPTDQIKSLYFKDANTGFAVGARKVFKTTDAGVTWTTQTVCVCTLHDIEFADANTAYVAGSSGTIYKSSNGGVSWSNSSLVVNSPTSNNIMEAKFADANNGYITGLGLIYKTTDGGMNWTAGVGTNLSGITINMLAANTWVIAGYKGEIFKTVDGTNWTSVRTGFTVSKINDINFPSANIGYVVGYPGVVFKSTDQGETWTDLSITSTYNMLSVDFVDDNTGYAVGQGGLIVKTINGGLNWTTLQSGLSYNITSVSFTDANTGFIVTNQSAGRIQKTTDGGATWTDVFTGSSQFQQIYFLNASTGIAISKNIIYRTVDAGTTWGSVFLGIGGFSIYDIFFVNNNLGYAGAESGHYFKTTDGGANWTHEQILEDYPAGGGLSGINVDLHFIGGPDVNTIYAGGRGGIVYVSYDAGSIWHTIDQVTTYDLNAFVVLDADKMLSVGNSGVILKTTNGGEACTAPEITYQPQDMSECDVAYLKIMLKKYHKNTTYVWKNGTTVIPSATTRFPTLTNLTPADGGNITCEVTNGCGTVTSNSMLLTIKLLPSVSAGTDQVVCEGNPATLTASGDASSYYWDNSVNDGIPFNPSITMDYIVVGLGANGCTKADTVKVTVSSCTGVKDQHKNNLAIKIYPNPSSEKLFIETEETILNVSLFDMKGQEVLRKNNSNELSLYGIGKGLYTLKIITNNGSVVKKLEVE